MIQSFNSQIELAHKYSGETFSHHYQVSDFNIYLKADAKNNIFLTRYTCPDMFQAYFEHLANFIQDKHLDSLISNLSASIITNLNLEKSSEVENYYFNIALLHFKEALYLYRGDIRTVSSVDSNSLLCRCMGIDEVTLKEIFTNTKGSRSEILKSSNMSLICGSCSVDFKNKILTLQKSLGFFEGKSFKDWKDEIEKLLVEFHFYSPKEFEGAQLSVAALSLPEVSINVMTDNPELEASLAKRSLANYLGQELGQPFDIKIFLNSPLSNSQT